MKFQETQLAGVWSIETEPHVDERGFFVRTYCEREFSERGLNTSWLQNNLTLTKKRGAIRGMHYQAEPDPEVKLIRCVTGAVFDVVVDIRKDSETYGRWQSFELSEENAMELYVPGGFAHGFQCLTDDCRLFYQMSSVYDSGLARGVRWDDPELSISWPLEESFLSSRDRELPSFSSLSEV